LQPVLRFVWTGKPSAAETGAVGVRSVEQGSRLLSGVQYVGGAYTASDGKKRIRCPKGWFVTMRPRSLGVSKPFGSINIYLFTCAVLRVPRFRRCINASVLYILLTTVGLSVLRLGNDLLDRRRASRRLLCQQSPGTVCGYGRVQRPVESQTAKPIETFRPVTD